MEAEWQLRLCGAFACPGLPASWTATGMPPGVAKHTSLGQQHAQRACLWTAGSSKEEIYTPWAKFFHNWHGRTHRRSRTPDGIK